VSRSHDAYEDAMQSVLHILHAHGLLARDGSSDSVRIAVSRLRETNRQLKKEIDDHPCDQTVVHGFENRVFRCTRRAGHSGEHEAIVCWADAIIGTSIEEKEKA
jgi:hypothetical protein